MRKWWSLIGLFVLLGIVAACAQPAAETKVVRETVVVEQTVEVPTGGQLVTLTARCKATSVEVGRCNNLVAAAGAANAWLADQGDDRRIEVEAIQDNKDWGEYKTEFELASQAGEAPDIVVSGHEHIGDWAPAGFILDITDMIDQHPEFDDVIDSLWESTKLNNRIWGVPQDAEVRPMYYSKPLLRELGWSDEEIDSLGERINAGEFSWEDMMDVATEAVEQGVVEEGNGWWHRPANGPDFLYYYYAAGGKIQGEGNKLIFQKGPALKVFEIIYDAAQARKILSPSLIGMDWNDWKATVSSAEQVLFTFRGSWSWPDWAANFVADRGGEAYLWENLGFSAIPGLEAGTGEPITLTHPLVYMISSQSEYPDLALLLIAKATTKELNTGYAVESGHLGILKSQADYKPYTSNKFLSEMLPLLEYTTFLPNSPYWSRWSEAYWLGIQSVQSGDLTPEEALDVVVDQLQNELGDNVVIE